MKQALTRGLKVAIHAGQAPPNRVIAEDYESTAGSGPIC
jgi:hypothetical protein